MQKNLRLIAGLIVARYECTYVRHCKENAPIYMYYVAPETPMMSSVIADCPDLAPPQYFGQVYAYAPEYHNDDDDDDDDNDDDDDEKFYGAITQHMPLQRRLAKKTIACQRYDFSK